MLHGKLIFIKKNGEDGSKYPFTEKNITIGRSSSCSIQIQNPLIALQHCQLIAEDNGQVKLKDLSNQTIFNGSPLKQGQVTLCHGDTFKIGDRVARWEAAQKSQISRQSLSSEGRLVAVVMPQQRTSNVNAVPSTSNAASNSSSSKNTPGDSKKKSEFLEGSINKTAKSSSTSKARSGFGGVAVSQRHSLMDGKVLFRPLVKLRKSTSEIKSLKSPKIQSPLKSRKSTLPSWKVEIKSPKRSVERKSTPIKKALPMKSSETLSRSAKTGLFVNPTTLNPIVEVSPTEPLQKRKTRGRPSESTAKKLFTPEKKLTPKEKRLVKSEIKRRSMASTNSLGKTLKLKRLSLVLNGSEGIPRKQSINSDISKYNSFYSDYDVDSVNLNSTYMTPRSDVMSTSEILKKKTNPKRKTSVMETTKISTKSSSSSTNNSPAFKRIRLSESESPPKSRLSSVTIRSLSEGKKSNSSRIRTVSPTLSSAERAAKKLKVSSPKKPDKNKKAALLVLGKANRNQSQPQKMKVMLKKKIVKKAIKQSTCTSIRALNKKKPVIKKLERNLTKKNSKKNNKKSEAKVKHPKNEINLSKDSESQLTVSKKANTTNLEFNGLKYAQGNISPISSVTQETVISLKMNVSPKKASTPKSQIKPKVASSVTKILSTTTDEFLYNSTRRSSKRLSSKNQVDRPDFMELSPTALGLMPKKIENVFKTPKSLKRRSSSLVTPKQSSALGIIKSASTSKIPNRKSVRFSSKDDSITSYFVGEVGNTPFNFDMLQTPNVTLDRFVSPLSEISSEISIITTENSQGSILKQVKSPHRVTKRKSCARKLLQSPQSPSSSKKDLAQKQPSFFLNEDSSRNDLIDTSEINHFPQKTLRSSIKSPFDAKDFLIINSESSATSETKSSLLNKSPKTILKNVESELKTPKAQKSPQNRLSNLKGVKKLLATPKLQRSPKNDLSDVRGVKKLLATPKLQRSPKNDLSDVRGVKKLLGTPKVQRSPKNDLSDVRGVKKLLATPKIQRSPKNDLSDIRGVKKLLATPKVQRSPKNDLSDVRGVKKLLATPKLQGSPKNDLSDVRGVKKLLGTPKAQRSPKNDLSDVRGVKKLLATPKVQRSPKNDLSDVRGVKKLLGTPKVQRSPKNDLSDVRGVKKLLATPKVQRSPKNDLSDVRGVKKLLATPKLQRSPKNDLSDVRGVKKLLATPKVQRSPKNDLSDVRGVKKLLATPKVQRSPKNRLSDLVGVNKLLCTPQNTNQKNLLNLIGLDKLLDLNKISAEEVEISPSVKKTNKSVTEVKQILISKTPSNSPASPIKTEVKSSLKKRISDLRNVRGRRIIYSELRSQKTNLTDVTRVQELFSKNPADVLPISPTGVAQLFDVPAAKVETSPVVTRSSKKIASKTKSKEAKKVEGNVNKSNVNDVEVRRGRPRKIVVPEIESLSSKRQLSGSRKIKETKATKRKAAEMLEVKEPKKILIETTKTPRGRKKAKSPEKSPKVVRGRSKSVASITLEVALPKLRSRRGESSPVQNNTEETPNVSTRRKVRFTPTKDSSIDRNCTTVSTKVRKASKKVISPKASTDKTSGKSKVQKEKLKGKTKVSPRKTRSVAAKAISPDKKSRKSKIQAQKSDDLKKEKSALVVKRSSKRK